METWQGKNGWKKKNKILNENRRGGSKRGRGRFPEPECPHSPGFPARCPHSWHGDEQNRGRLTGLLVRLNLAKLCNMLTRYSPAMGALWVRVEVSWGVQTSRIWTGERQREDCRCRNNVNKGLEVGSTHFNPVVGLGAKHRKHGNVMNKDQSGDRS